MAVRLRLRLRLQQGIRVDYATQAVIVEMLRACTASRGRGAVVVCANNTQKKNFEKLMAEFNIQGCKVQTLHAAVGHWPGCGRETAQAHISW